MAYRGPFDGFHASEASVSKTCPVRFDNNRYSVAARAVGRPVDVRACAGSDEEARRAAQRRALQGLAVAQRARSPADPAVCPRRRRPAVRQGSRGGAGGRAGGGRGGLRRGACLQRQPAPPACSTSCPGGLRLWTLSTSGTSPQTAAPNRPASWAVTPDAYSRRRHGADAYAGSPPGPVPPGGGERWPPRSRPPSARYPAGPRERTRLTLRTVAWTCTPKLAGSSPPTGHPCCRPFRAPSDPSTPDR